MLATTIEGFWSSASVGWALIAPACGFCGGLGNLLTIAAVGEWREADEITLA